MKSRKIIDGLFLLFCGIVFFIQIAGVLFWPAPHYGEYYANDLRLRWNESQCARQGVNSFRIWNRESQLAGFSPLSRPDMPDAKPRQGNKIVHAYPAWHMVFFWWMGWLSEPFCIGLAACLFGLCVAYIYAEFKRVSVMFGLSAVMVLFFSLAAAIRSGLLCFSTLNYGVLTVAASILLFRLLSADRQFCAGIVWSLMMIKPQLGLLFFWPILFKRKFLTIGVAVCFCVMSAVVMGRYYHESPFDLILQIPKIGMPYGCGPIVDKILAPILGSSANYVWMGCCFIVCGVACYLLRKSSYWFVCCAPVVLTVPLWTYSMRSDDVMQWIWYLCVSSMAFRRGGRGVVLWQVYAFVLVCSELLSYGWTVSCERGLVDFSGLGWLYYAIKYGMISLSLLMLLKLERSGLNIRANRLNCIHDDL